MVREPNNIQILRTREYQKGIINGEHKFQQGKKEGSKRIILFLHRRTLLNMIIKSTHTQSRDQRIKNIKK